MKRVPGTGSVLISAWAAVALVSIWVTRLRLSDPSLAITTGALFFISLAFSRCVLRLPFVSAPMLYLVLLGLFHLGLVLPWALRIYDVSRIPEFVPYGLSQAMTLIIGALVAYQAGLIFATGIGNAGARSISRIAPVGANRALLLAGACLAATGVIMFVVGLIGLDPEGYYRLTYSETFRLRAESDPRFFGSGIMFASIGLTIATSGASRRQMRIVFLASGLWTLGLLYWGFRGPAVILALIVYVVAVKKGLIFPRWLPIVAALILLMALPALETMREQSDRFLGATLGQFNVLDAPAEMGASIRPLIETAAIVDASNLRYGRTYWIGIKGIIPNLAWRWEAPDEESLDDLPPNHWITAIADPWSYKNYGGMGFSAIAEPYMNFGTAGVIVFFAVLAIGLVKLDRVSITSCYALAAWAIILGPLLWTTRNDSTNFFRPAVWGLLYLGTIWVLANRSSLPHRSLRHLPLRGRAVVSRNV
jgi:hypothetical protein